MCGIFGAIRTEGFFNQDDFDRFVRLTDLVRYRGPDDSGYTPLNLKEGQAACSRDRFDVFLGHRRLSIIDLSSAGHQPMSDNKGRWITFNGEIFNYVELRTQLSELKRAFRTATDTEVILHLYDEYGADGFSQLNGMWAFAIADSATRTVVLSRDRFSMKPLYITSAHHCIYFASEIKQLLPLTRTREVNVPVMSAYLSQALLDHTPDTFFRQIRQLPPRTNLSICVQSGVLTERAYWCYPVDIRNNGEGTQDLIARFRDLLVDSTRIRLRSDVELGVLLSGGLDSSTLAVIAHQLEGNNVGTYSVVSNQQAFTEERFVDALCHGYGIRNRKLSFCITDVLGTLDQVLHHNDEPFMGFSALAQFAILSMIKRETGVTVLLSGQGGDEILLGYLKFFFFHLKRLVTDGYYLRAMRAFLASLVAGTVVHQFRLSEARRYIRPLAARSKHRFFRIQPSTVPVWECATIPDRQIQDLDKYSVPTLTHYEDRNSMAHSMELRHPFLDHRLVEFALRLPTELKLRDGWTKSIMREAFPELPDVIRWRRDKQPFITPEEQWLKVELADVITGSFQKSRLGDMGILDDPGFLGAYRAFQKGSPLVSYGDIARVFIAEQWLRCFVA